MTTDWLVEGRYNVHLWALEGLGVDIHDAQIELAIATVEAEAQYFKCDWANRTGKTTIIVILHMHRLFYKLGIPEATDEHDYEARWLPSAYRTLHCAPLNRLSGRAFQAVTEILKGTSEAQLIRERNHCPLREGDVVGQHRPAPLAAMFTTQRERIETGADKLFLRCLTGGVCEFDTTEGGGGRLEGVAYRFITWDEWPQQEAADKGEAVNVVLTRLTNRGSDFDAPIVLTGTITPDTEHISKEWDAFAGDPENAEWWGNHASRDLNPSASLRAIERAKRLVESGAMDQGDFDRTIMGVAGGVRGRVFPDVLVDPMFDIHLPPFTGKEEGFEYLHLWDIALTTAENVGLVLRIPADWQFSPEKPIVGVRMKVVPGSRTLTPAEIKHTIAETYLPYGGVLVIDTTDAHGKGIQRELRLQGLPAEEFDFHGPSERKGVIAKDAAIRNARELLEEGAPPLRGKDGEPLVDPAGVVLIDLSHPHGVFRLPAAWHKVHDQLSALREDDKGQKKDAAMAWLMGARVAWKKRRMKRVSGANPKFGAFRGRRYSYG